MKRILVIGTGGTIGSVRDGVIRPGNPFSVIGAAGCNDADFECASPFSVLSENICFSLWEQLTDFLNALDFSRYAGVIILHGSDTLAYTGALLANMFCDRSICLVASNKPIGEPGSNGEENFRAAVDFLRKKGRGVVISYDGIRPADCTVSADEGDAFLTAGKPQPRIENPVFTPKNILVIRPYVNMSYDCYSLDGVDAVLHTMYHSATAPHTAADFARKCSDSGVFFSFVTTKSRAEYESAAAFNNIIFDCTVENAYARLLLTKRDDCAKQDCRI